jgi:hypothetical protein
VAIGIAGASPLRSGRGRDMPPYKCAMNFGWENEAADETRIRTMRRFLENFIFDSS